MDRNDKIKRLCDFYIRRVAIIGALYCIVPTVVGYAAGFVLVRPFRTVYVLRMMLSLVIGGPVAAYVNRFGLSLWLIKHRSAQGPATVLDGALIGAASGIGTALLPPLTALIATNHPERAKVFIIVTWLISIVLGAVIGGTLAALGRKHVERGN
ncbi:hypothetical protein FJY63_02270 [Candidatus Sumerlaeota bacterium]|nr:hypothetical protein [Candidatus Sumerlaeota bacterium]